MKDTDKHLSDFLYPSQPISKYFKTAPNILLAYCFQPSFFSVYKSLLNQNDKNAWAITNHSFGLSSCIYIIVALLSLMLYGEYLKSDLLLNITEKEDNNLKYICSVLFVIIAALHTPVIFFVGKESLLMIY